MTVTTTETDLPQLPFDRPGVLEVAPLYDALRDGAPVARVLTPAGDPAWLVTGYAEARVLFADDRLGRSHPAPAEAAQVSDAGFLGGPTGEIATEKRNHTRMRKLLLPAFSAKRMRSLGDHVDRLVDGLVDDLVAANDAADGAPVDLHSLVATSLPIAVICALLGVPVTDRAYFTDLSSRAVKMVGEDPRQAKAELETYTARLAEPSAGSRARTSSPTSWPPSATTQPTTPSSRASPRACSSRATRPRCTASTSGYCCC